MNAAKKERYLERGFVAAVLLFAFLWAAVQPFDVSPDERMRYEIVDYLCRYHRLPHGGDPALRNQIWGISYAFNPIVSYMISAVFVQAAGLFTENGQVLVVAARMTNVLFTAGTAYFVLKIGGRMFSREAKWLFAALVTLLPGFLFVGSYVNNDAMALFASAWILWSWVRSLDEGWSIRNSLFLGAGLGICFLSYYNAYGWILLSFLFFTFTALFCEGKAWNGSLWLKRGLLVAAVALVLCGWWFVRNAVIYDGDLLGMRTSSLYAERYAAEGFQPSKRLTPQKQGIRLWEMLWLHPQGWNHNWLITVLVSFVGTFGYLNVFMPYALSKCYWLLFAVGAAGLWRTRRMFGFRKICELDGRLRVGADRMRFKGVAVSRDWDKQRVFHTALAAAAGVPVVLLLRYSWASDFQAQGRYLLPMLLPMMYFVTKGWQNLAKRYLKKPLIQKILYRGLFAVLAAFAVYTFGFVFYPAFAG